MKAYNELVDLCIQLKDNGTHELALEILDGLRGARRLAGDAAEPDQSVGLQNYLAEHMFEDDEDGKGE